MPLKNDLRTIRFNNGRMTQAALAEKLGIARQTVIAVEGGRFNPSVKLALRMAALFKCNVEELFYLTEEEE